jgi:hypothetical protein
VKGPRVSVSSQYKKDNRWPNSQERRSGFTNHSPALAGEPCMGYSKFPTYIYYSAHEIPIAA